MIQCFNDSISCSGFAPDAVISPHTSTQRRRTMHRLSSIVVALIACGGFMLASAGAANNMEAAANIQPSKAAATQPSNTNVTGTVTFTQQDQDVHVVADLTGLSPGKHGIHIHEKDDLSDPQ